MFMFYYLFCSIYIANVFILLDLIWEIEDGSVTMRLYSQWDFQTEGLIENDITYSDSIWFGRIFWCSLVSYAILLSVTTNTQFICYIAICECLHLLFLLYCSLWLLTLTISAILLSVSANTYYFCYIAICDC